MAGPAPAEKQKLAEDRVGAWLNGVDKCSLTVHPEASRLDRLVMRRMLLLLDPHDPSNLHEIDALIRLELKK